MKLTIGYKMILCNLVFASLLFVISLASCEKDKTTSVETEYKKIAWNSLGAESQATVIAKWEDAGVSYQQYKGQEVAAVRFNTTQDGLLGPIVIYVSVENKTVLGGQPRE